MMKNLRLWSLFWLLLLLSPLPSLQTAGAQDRTAGAQDRTQSRCGEEELWDSRLNACRPIFSIRYTGMETKEGMKAACLDDEVPLACASWGLWAYRRGNFETVDEEAGLLCRSRCEEGDPQGCACLSIMVGHGLASQEQDGEEGLRLAHQSCEDQVGWGCNLWAVLDNRFGTNTTERQRLGYYQRGCTYGDPFSCANIGYFYLFDGPIPDEKVARARFREGCRHRIGWACGMYGYLVLGGRGGSADERGMEIMHLACEMGDPVTCQYLGQIYGVGPMRSEVAVNQDLERAQYFLREACNARWAQSCEYWVSLSEQFFPEQVENAAITDALYIACRRQRALACARLGWDYLQGNRELQISFEWARWGFFRACVRDHDESCFQLGKLHMNGQGKSSDTSWPHEYNLAYQAFNRACQNGHLRGCTYLGRLYLEGAGVERSPQRARNYFTEACRSDEGSGCSWLAFWMEFEHSRPVPATEIIALHQRACELGESRSCLDLGLLYSQGRKDAEVDQSQALYFFDQACNQELPAGCGYLGLLIAQGGPEWESRPAAARRLLHNSCTGGFGPGCHWLGELDLHARRLSDARRAFLVGCHRNQQESCLRAASMLRNGEGGPVNEQRARKLENQHPLP